MTQRHKIGYALAPEGYHIAYAVLGQGELCHVFMAHGASVVDISRATLVGVSLPDSPLQRVYSSHTLGATPLNGKEVGHVCSEALEYGDRQRSQS